MMKILKILFLILMLSLSVQAENKYDFDQPIEPDLYLMRPGDSLLITFVNSQLSPLTMGVDPEGGISDKNFGIISLKDKTLSETRDILSAILSKYYQADEIFISIKSSRMTTITISGAVRNPGVYRASTAQRVSDIIKMAKGVLGDGSRRNILFTGSKIDLMVDLDRSEFIGDFSADPNLYAGYHIIVPGKSDQVVQVAGEVNRPRQIEILAGDDLATIIQLAGGLRTYADIDNLDIYRGNQKVTSEKIISGDIIFVPTKKEFTEPPYLFVFGAVNNPGQYEFEDNISFKNLIDKVGGYSSNANPELSTVFRKPLVGLDGRYTSLRYPIGNLLSSGENQIMLTRGDSVFVPVKVGYVIISGAVLNPGYFPYFKGKDAAYYLQAAGGFLPTANEETIKIHNPVSKITSASSPEVIVFDGTQIIVDIREELK